MKRALDIAVCVLAAPVLLPLLLVCALALAATSRESFIFREWRLGHKGDPIRVWRFRSTTALRANNLEELPQLWNVLRGEMSLVGPHADPVDQLLMYAERDRMRLRVKPGLTGLAQITGRDAISWEQRRLLDVEYVKSHTLWMDLTILAKTVACVFSGKGLYTADPPVSPRVL